MTCERCLKSLDEGEHGQYLCPLEPRSSKAAVISDEIPGGVEIRHGLCHPDGTPRKFFSKSEIARAAKAAGLVNVVRHVGAKGSDKSKHTVRWF